jgi:glycosyltransferase involved in cell wall biosynthesis
MTPDSLQVPSDRPDIERINLSPWLVSNPFIRTLWERFFFPQLLKQLKIEILFCPGGSVSSGVPKSCKVITTFQNMMPFDFLQRKKYPLGYMRFRNWILEKKLLKSMIRSDLVIFISEYAKSVIEKRSHGKIKKSVIIPHGVNPKFKSDPCNQLTPPSWLPENGYLLYVSILDVYKAQVEVVEAYALLKSRKRNIPKLLLIGPEYGPYGQKVRQAIAKNNLTDDVIIIGAIKNSELPAVYQNAHINIFASETENCPFILLEALAAGRPLLVSSKPPMPEFAGDAVIYFNPGVPSELATQLEIVLDDSNLRDKLSAKALERSNIYNWEQAAMKTWQAFENLK